MPEPRDPINIPVRDNLGAGAAPVPEAPAGDANPDLQRSATPGPIPLARAQRAPKRADAGEGAAADVEERPAP